jgi:hypothetical protein
MYKMKLVKMHSGYGIKCKYTLLDYTPQCNFQGGVAMLKEWITLLKTDPKRFRTYIN